MVRSSGGTEDENCARPGSQTGLAFLVGFFFAFRLFIMLLSVRLLGTDNQTGVEVSLGLGFLLLLLALFQSLGTVRHQTVRLSTLPSVRWVALFLIFSGCSLAWTAASSLLAATAFWCAMVADVGIVALLLRVGPVKEVATVLIQGYVLGACAVAIIAWLLPAQSDLRLGDEELLGANQIGYLCAFAAFMAQYLMREQRGRWGPAAALLSLTLLRSLSKTSIVAFLVAEALLLMTDKSMSRRTKVMLVLGSIATGIAFSGLLASYFDIYTTGNSPETLTGRLGIWAVFFSEAIEQPWLGHGFHSAWKVIPPFGEFEARHAHNELLQQFYAYGVVGICMLVGLYGSFYRQIRTLKAGTLRTFLSAFLLFILVRGLTDTEPFDLSLPMWAIVIFSLLIGHARATENEATAAVPIGYPVPDGISVIAPPPPEEGGPEYGALDINGRLLKKEQDVSLESRDVLTQLLEQEKMGTCGQESKRAYTETHKGRFADILRLCRKQVPDASARVLDIGRSELTGYLSSFYRNIHTLGLDPSIDDGGHREMGMIENVPHIQFDLLNSRTISDWPDCGRFDLIVFSEVIEHLDIAPEYVLAFLRSLLSDEGLLLCSTPNAADLAKRVRLALGRNPYERIRLYSANPGHVREYTKRELREIAGRVGLRWMNHSYVNWIQGKAGNRIMPAVMGILRFYPPFRSFQVCLLTLSTPS